MSYVGYRISKWETPVSNIKQFALERLFKSEDAIPDLPGENEPPALIVVIRDVQENKQFRFLFHRCLALTAIRDQTSHKKSYLIGSKKSPQ